MFGISAVNIRPTSESRTTLRHQFLEGLDAIQLHQFIQFFGDRLKV